MSIFFAVSLFILMSDVFTVSAVQNLLPPHTFNTFGEIEEFKACPKVQNLLTGDGYTEYVESHSGGRDARAVKDVCSELARAMVLECGTLAEICATIVGPIMPFDEQTENIWHGMGYDVSNPLGLWNLTHHVHCLLIAEFGVPDGVVVCNLEPSGAQWMGEFQPHSHALFMIFKDSFRDYTEEMMVFLAALGFRLKSDVYDRRMVGSSMASAIFRCDFFSCVGRLLYIFKFFKGRSGLTYREWRTVLARIGVQVTPYLVITIRSSLFDVPRRACPPVAMGRNFLLRPLPRIPDTMHHYEVLFQSVEIRKKLLTAALASPGKVHDVELSSLDLRPLSSVVDFASRLTARVEEHNNDEGDEEWPDGFFTDEFLSIDADEINFDGLFVTHNTLGLWRQALF